MTLSLILAESALEVVPARLQRHNSVRAHARRLGKRPSQILLDNSWHFAAMKGVDNEIKRGRPDIVHFALLAATSTPLYAADGIRVYVHTVEDRVIEVGPRVNLPRSYHRFAGVVEGLYDAGRVGGGGGGSGREQALLELRRGKTTLADLVGEIGPSQVIGLSTLGRPSSFADVARTLPSGDDHDEDACLVIGGFQKGHFGESVTRSVDQLYRVGDRALDSHTVTGRILYEYEKAIFM